MNVSRVAAVTITFWVLKILSTGMGETGADYLDHTFSPYLVIGLTFIAFGAALAWQFTAPRYSAARYWLAVVMVSVFGTLAADAVHVVLQVPYWLSTTVFALALVIIFAVWYRVEGNLRMTDITTRRREFLYWLAVLASFALGTAAGDWIALSLGFGFLGGTVVFTVLFALPLILGRLRVLQTTVAFWIAYTFTRPMGASFADWLALPHARGGLGLGTLLVTGIWTVLIVALILAMNVKSRTVRS